MVERSLSMREVSGSIPDISIFAFLSLNAPKCRPSSLARLNPRINTRRQLKCINLTLCLKYECQRLHASHFFNQFCVNKIKSKKKSAIKNILVKAKKVPSPGFEPGSSRPQREILTTILRWPGEIGYRSRHLSHAKRALYHLSYIPFND